MLNLLRVNRHDNIVESHSFSNHSLTKAFLVMEYMEVCATLTPSAFISTLSIAVALTET